MSKVLIELPFTLGDNVGDYRILARSERDRWFTAKGVENFLTDPRDIYLLKKELPKTEIDKRYNLGLLPCDCFGAVEGVSVPEEWPGVADGVMIGRPDGTVDEYFTTIGQIVKSPIDMDAAATQYCEHYYNDGRGLISERAFYSLTPKNAGWLDIINKSAHAALFEWCSIISEIKYGQCPAARANVILNTTYNSLLRKKRR